MQKAAEILDVAANKAADEGLYSHGALTPDRVVVDDTGKVQLIGYGVPQVEVFAYLDEDIDEVDAAAFRYTPPERLEDKDEDFRSDLYSLVMIGAEALFGEPVYDESDPEKLIDQVLNGEAPEVIESLGEELSDEMLDLLCPGVELNPSDRFNSVSDWWAKNVPIAFGEILSALLHVDVHVSAFDIPQRGAQVTWHVVVDVPEVEVVGRTDPDRRVPP